jgi:hypothetical protein
MIEFDCFDALVFLRSTLPRRLVDLFPERFQAKKRGLLLCILATISRNPVCAFNSDTQSAETIETHFAEIVRR